MFLLPMYIPSATVTFLKDIMVPCIHTCVLYTSSIFLNHIFILVNGNIILDGLYNLMKLASGAYDFINISIHSISWLFSLRYKIIRGIFL